MSIVSFIISPTVASKEVLTIIYSIEYKFNNHLYKMKGRR